MKKRKLGNTELYITPLGLGVGGILGMKAFNEQKALNLIQASIDEGINFFDTGSAYSYGNTEVRLGKVLSNNTLDNIIIATKGGTVLTKNNTFAKNFSRESLTDGLNISLKKLHIERIDLFQLHSPSIKHLTDDVFETLTLFKDQGKVNNIGISCDNKVLDYVIEKDFFDTVMLTYNILNQEPEKQIIKAKKQGLGVLIKSPMAHSLYSNDIFKLKGLSDIWYLLRVLKNYRPELFKGLEYRFINNEIDWSGSEIALKFVLDNSNVDCSLIGTTKINHLKSNINVTKKELPKLIIDKIKSIANNQANITKEGK